LLIVLISYSPPEVLLFVMASYALSGYIMWIQERFEKVKPE
jgi:hypothetical protein